MFGLVMGVAAFSALSSQWARQELVRYQQQQAERAKANATDVAKGMDFAILTETAQTYSDNYDLERARPYSNTDARTRGGQDYLVTARDDEDRKSYDKTRTTVAITGSDDTLLRSQMYRSGSSEEILRTKVGQGQAVATYDTATARDRQVRTSNERMEVLAEQVYAFYAAKKRFPTDNEFSSLGSTFDLRDAWGRNFTYKPSPDNQKGILSFTTPWNYTQTLKLSLKDEADAPE